MFSGVPLLTDIARLDRHVANVPMHNRRLSGKKNINSDVNQFTYGEAARPQYECSTLQFSVWSFEKLDCREARHAVRE